MDKCNLSGLMLLSSFIFQVVKVSEYKIELKHLKENRDKAAEVSLVTAQGINRSS